MSKPNYWAESLGFDSQVKVAPAATEPTASSETVPAPSDSDEANELEAWLNKFGERAKEKEASIAQRATEQIRRDDEEVEKWKALRKRDEEERRQREEELQRGVERARIEEERKRQDQAEESRILSCTQGLNDDERAAWVLEEQELLKLENDFNNRNLRLEGLNDILKQSAAQYDMKIAFDAMVEATEVAANEHQAVKHKSYQEAEIDAFIAFAVDSRSSVSEANEWEYRELKKLFVSQKRAISRQERVVAFQTLDQNQQAALMARSEDDRDNVLDEVVLLTNLSRTLKQQALVK